MTGEGERGVRASGGGAGRGDDDRGGIGRYTRGVGSSSHCSACSLGKDSKFGVVELHVVETRRRLVPQNAASQPATTSAPDVKSCSPIDDAHGVHRVVDSMSTQGTVSTLVLYHSETKHPHRGNK